MHPESEENSNRDCRALDLSAAQEWLGNLVENEQDMPTSSSGSPEISGEGRTPRRHCHRPSRSRHRAHRSRRRTGRRRIRFKQRERNFAAAVCSMLAIVTLCTALAEPRWLWLSGGSCNVKSLGVSQFFSLGSFEATATPTHGGHQEYVYHYDSEVGMDAKLVNCVNLQAVQVMKVIIVLCFVGALLSLMAFFLDLAGPTSGVLKFIRHNALLSLLTVVLCVVVVGMTYWVSEIIAGIQRRVPIHRGSKIAVQFDVSFYLITAAGAISVIGSACNLLRHQQANQQEAQDRANLLDYYDVGAEPAPLSPDYYAPMLNIPPPPAYSP